LNGDQCAFLVSHLPASEVGFNVSEIVFAEPVPLLVEDNLQLALEQCLRSDQGQAADYLRPKVVQALQRQFHLR
jgi:hypothetical protein